MAYERQAVILRQAEETRRNACVAGTTEECANAAALWQSEMSLYQQLQEAYQSCLQLRRPAPAVSDEFWFAPQFRLAY
jgi:hypothetical protein